MPPEDLPEKQGTKRPHWLLLLAIEAKEEISIVGIIRDSGVGIMLGYLFLKWKIAEPTENKELYWGAVCFALGAPFFGFLVRGLFVAPAKLYRKLEARVEALEERLRPKFILQCSPKILGCKNIIIDKRLAIYRLQVQTNANEIEGCRGFVTKIEKEGMVVFNQKSLELPFAPSE